MSHLCWGEGCCKFLYRILHFCPELHGKGDAALIVLKWEKLPADNKLELEALAAVIFYGVKNNTNILLLDKKVGVLDPQHT